MKSPQQHHYLGLRTNIPNHNLNDIYSNTSISKNLPDEIFFAIGLSLSYKTSAVFIKKFLKSKLWVLELYKDLDQCQPHKVVWYIQAGLYTRSQLQQDHLQKRTHVAVVTLEAGGVPFQVGGDTEDELVGDGTPTPCTHRGIDSFIWGGLLVVNKIIVLCSTGNERVPNGDVKWYYYSFITFNTVP